MRVAAGPIAMEPSNAEQRKAEALLVMASGVLAILSMLPLRSVCANDEGDADRHLQARLTVICESANGLSQRKQQFLLSKELHALVQEISTMPDIGEAVSGSLATLASPSDPSSCCGGQIVVRLPNRAWKTLATLSNRYMQILSIRGYRDLATELQANFQRAGEASRFLEACEHLAVGGSDDRLMTILSGLPPQYQQAVALLRAPDWSEADEANLADLAEACRQFSLQAFREKSPSALTALDMAIFLDWLREPDGPALRGDLDSLTETARSLYDADEAAWRVNQTAAPHFVAMRYGLASKIYSAVYKAQGGALRSAECFAALRLVRCDWQEGEVMGTLWAERPKTWQLLKEIAPKCGWDQKLEPEFLYVIRNMQATESQYAEIVEPYYRMVMVNGSTLDLRHEAARMLGFMLECTERFEAAASAYAAAINLTDVPEDKAYYARKASELRQAHHLPGSGGTKEKARND